MIFCFLKITDLVQHFYLFLTVFYFVVDTLDVNLVDINLVYQVDKPRVTVKGNRDTELLRIAKLGDGRVSDTVLRLLEYICFIKSCILKTLDLYGR